MRFAPTACFAVALHAITAHAAGDIAEGRRLVAQQQCENCHHNLTLGDAKAVYLRKDRKVTSWGKLTAQVAACNTRLNLKLFPDEEESIAAYLNDEYYRFPASSDSRSMSR